MHVDLYVAVLSSLFSNHNNKIYNAEVSCTVGLYDELKMLYHHSIYSYGLQI